MCDLQEFLNKLNMCSSIKDDQIQQWHPKFVVDDVPDVEPALLPQPPVVKKFMTAKDVLDEVKDRHVDPQVMIRNDTVYIMYSKKLTCGQLSLPHGTNRKIQTENELKLYMMSLVQSRDVCRSPGLMEVC